MSSVAQRAGMFCESRSGRLDVSADPQGERSRAAVPKNQASLRDGPGTPGGPRPSATWVSSSPSPDRGGPIF